ncbi:MAG TPA: prepilin-type N-terminal cleavage/methylation domain-containing protein [Bryobacteraceae bacterium]|nr:prepilin-type N-terminal cleavage/methylation domain-containing protein [Bryobacteraceae bacterium]
MRNNGCRGFTFMEMVIVVAIIMAIAVVAIPSLQAARIRSNETSAVRMLHTLNTAQIQHQSETGKFASSLPALRKWITPRLASGTHTGYLFGVEATPDGYRLTAQPERVGSTGQRIFHSDQTLLVTDGDGNDIAP